MLRQVARREIDADEVHDEVGQITPKMTPMRGIRTTVRSVKYRWLSL